MVGPCPHSIHLLDTRNLLPTHQATLSPLTPLEGDVEMYSRGKPQPIFSIDTQIANRMSQLSIVPELDTPATFLEVGGERQFEIGRPVSEVTEILDEESDDLSEFEEDSEGLSFESVIVFALSHRYIN
jgi:hypothetical protein